MTEDRPLWSARQSGLFFAVCLVVYLGLIAWGGTLVRIAHTRALQLDAESESIAQPGEALFLVGKADQGAALRLPLDAQGRLSETAQAQFQAQRLLRRWELVLVESDSLWGYLLRGRK